MTDVYLNGWVTPELFVCLVDGLWLVSILVPSPLGPRKFGQFCACISEVEFTINNVIIKIKYLKWDICLLYSF